jgi:NifB/MoaA-like Fe-S oxidoreductase
MPKGFRKSLYLKDDDYRLGFLYGNFVTLTNLKDDDWQRIEEQHLSPMYVSVHATDPTLRAIMLGKPDVPDVLEQIRHFGELGISVHTQIVATPGVNDGAALHQSIRELAALYPTVESIAVVPVGLTKYRFTGKAPQTIKAAIHVHETPEWIDENWEKQPLWDEAFGKLHGSPAANGQQPPTIALMDSSPKNARQPSVGDELGYCSRQIISTDVPMRCYTSEEAGQIIDLIAPYQQEFQREYGINLVYPSDEFYILAKREVPPAATYDDMPQYSNGVGMTRDFLDGWAKTQRRLPARMPKPTEVVLVCGTLIAPILQRVVDRLNRVENLRARLLPVVNQFFGEMVTVSGLLTGQDVANALRVSGGERALLPRVMFDHTGKRTLDEYSIERIAEDSGVPVAIAGEPDEVVRYIRALARGSEF